MARLDQIEEHVEKLVAKADTFQTLGLGSGGCWGMLGDAGCGVGCTTITW